MFHFQTKYYGAHKASDHLHEKFGDLYDRFLEVYQGKHGRIPRVEGEITLHSLKDSTIIPFCQKFVQLLTERVPQILTVREDSDLCNIIDEMKAEINQFIYLLSFR
jgi:hypothetical protein